MALVADTVGAALACPAVAEVLVVTADPRVAATTGAAGARVVPERPDAGLNAALRLGVDTAVADGDERTWVAALTADLPALRPTELAAALHAVVTGPPGVRRFVADAPGTGTALLAAPPGVPLDPGSGSTPPRPTWAPGRCRWSAPGRACGATWTPPPTWSTRPGSASARPPAR